ncbi:MAG TPA: AAA family ATPase, partial [Chloroflexota bacterium]|nr:AAA family ATPase [Chloroflexota bacterium]
MFEIERRVEGASAPPFLTKVVTPRVAVDRTLRRERLLERLHAQLAPGQRATLVTAPAGYGKTTLLAQFAAEVDALTAWCTLDEHDRDGATLLGYLVAAVAGRVQGFGWRTRGALAALAAGEGVNGGGRGAGETQQLRGAVGTFVTELQGLDDFLLLVVDDCHVLLGEASASRVLDLLIEHLPEHCHVILAGRSLPEIPCLAALTARRQAEQLDVWQLRLTPEETGELVARAGIGKLSAEEAEALHGEAQGWP